MTIWHYAECSCYAECLYAECRERCDAERRSAEGHGAILKILFTISKDIYNASPRLHLWFTFVISCHFLSRRKK